MPRINLLTTPSESRIQPTWEITNASGDGVATVWALNGKVGIMLENAHIGSRYLDGIDVVALRNVLDKADHAAWSQRILAKAIDADPSDPIIPGASQ